MKHAYRSFSGGPAQTCHQAPSPDFTGPGDPDKWQILDALTEAAPDYGIGHRTLGVLRALLTFFPNRALPAEGAVVFPSNRTLSDRLHGMPESTLRRHLARLVDRGVLARCDSPNRKRYAKCVDGVTGIAFGFDLSPLHRSFAALRDAARAVRLRRERLTLLRERVKLARFHYEQSPDSDPHLCDHVGRVLRRKASADDLQSCLDTLPAIPKMSGSDSQNDRHIQESNEPDSECDTKVSTITPAENSVTTDNVAVICREYRTYFPDSTGSWRDLRRETSQLAHMIGIMPMVYHDAVRDMGANNAAVSVLCILERLGEIKSPGAYLRRLSQRARQGDFSIAGMLAAVKRQTNCQLTMD